MAKLAHSKLDGFCKRVESWLSWSLEKSISNAIEVYWAIKDVIDCSEKPVVSDLISRREFS